MIPDHYQALGVQPHAARDEIRAAYLRLMREHHPDRRPEDPTSADRARQANEAWAVLGDGAERASYDRLRLSRHGRGPTTARPTVVRRDGDVVLRSAAYSDERVHYRRAFSVACLRVGVAVLIVGVVLSLGLTTL